MSNVHTCELKSNLRKSSRTLGAWERLALLVDDLHVLDDEAPFPALVLAYAALERRLVLHVHDLRKEVLGKREAAYHR